MSTLRYREQISWKYCPPIRVLFPRSLKQISGIFFDERPPDYFLVLSIACYDPNTFEEAADWCTPMHHSVVLLRTSNALRFVYFGRRFLRKRFQIPLDRFLGYILLEVWMSKISELENHWTTLSLLTIIVISDLAIPLDYCIYEY